MDVESPETRYRSRILREMNANRENPFNSPPSSTGSHGTLDPTMTSIITDHEGETTRKLNEDIARITGNGRKPSIDWEAIHKKWPDFYPKPKPLHTESRKYASKNTPSAAATAPSSPASGLGSETKENRPPKAAKKRFSMDDFTLSSFTGSSRTRAEMQPRVDSDSDNSSVLNLSPDRLSLPPPSRLPHQPQNRSPLAREHTRSPSTPNDSPTPVRRMSLPAALCKQQFNASTGQSPQKVQRKLNFAQHVLSKEVKAATKQKNKKQPSTAADYLPSSQRTSNSAFHNDNETMGSTSRSFVLPDVSNLGDFVSGTLRFDGTIKNGIPILVKNGQVVDVGDQQQTRRNSHTAIGGLKAPEDEEKIFVSMDMIRDEVVALQEHDEMVQDYAEDLQKEVEELQAQIEVLKGRSFGNTMNLEKNSDEKVSVNETLLEEKKQLEEEVIVLRFRLQEVTKKLEVLEAEKHGAITERDRAMKKLQGACENINDLMGRLDMSQHELHVTQKQLDATLDVRETDESLANELKVLKEANKKLRAENEPMRREAQSLRENSNDLRQENESIKQEVKSLRQDNSSLRKENESLMKENQSLRSSSRQVMTENEELRKSIDLAKGEVSGARVELERLHEVIAKLEEEKAVYQQDNHSLERHNDKYFSDNKTLRLQASNFERNLQDLNSDNEKLKQEVEYLKTHLEHIRQTTVVRETRDMTGTAGGPTLTRGIDDDNMTSAFFVPDITVHTEDNTAPFESTRTFNRRLLTRRQQLLAQQTQTMDVTEDLKDNTPTQVVDFTASSFKDMETGEVEDNSVDMRPATTKATKTGNTVKFDVPDLTMTSAGDQSQNLATSSTPAANRSSKRRSSIKTTQAPAHKDDTETGSVGFASNDNTRNFSVRLEKDQQDVGENHTSNTKTGKKMHSKKPSNNLEQDFTNMSLGRSHMQNMTQNFTEQFSQRLDTHNTVDFTLHSTTGGMTGNVTRGETRNTNKTSTRSVALDKETCPALSVDARKVFDDLCEHSCRNCNVCSRISAHTNVVSPSELAEGKKRVSVARPIPVSDRISFAAVQHFEEPTMRPSQPPGNALAIVIKALEDESEHLNMELAGLQARYNALDKSLGKRERREVASQLRAIIKKLEAKNDQIYALYDVLEGQKQAGQMMTEEQLETTIMNITGMNVAGVDLSQQLTWEGIRDA
ncbi:Spindle pole body protein ppc89 [Ceratocystis fimbriata CBS 114723]|uniref:Spindle pole body protein ppc89 n=1 Tax=Ceratocystis fimbriata CBS 114723 TaxID=1035309 RepID=A0A2C5X3Z1_9PEZI|nr:Spindle pole body protein ppc89 [Ceratocystis fimbriata CBS 114723]